MVVFQTMMKRPRWDSNPRQASLADLQSANPVTNGDNDNNLQTPISSVNSSVNSSHQNPDLRRVIEAWPTMPPAIRAAVLALVDSQG